MEQPSQTTKNPARLEKDLAKVQKRLDAIKE
jgi:hypothetical protein